ncbi:MAG: transglycosylase SLT domain-containing protein [Candidatus Margulisbacteria bacterium]|jgi:soluble lytic murein transglycosylase|nr:transglycosylase SLT domain-containing protein [Candidatus Margulisiibacteriota bacterium]
MLRFILIALFLLELLCAADLDYAQAKKYLREERYPEAAKVLAYVGAHRRYLRPYCDYYRAVAASRQKQYIQAARMLEKYTAQQNIPYQDAALELLNECYVQLGREQDIQPLAAHKQALRLFRQVDYQGALRLWQLVSANGAMSLLPEDSYYYLARSYMYCADPEEARRILESRSGAGAVYYLGALAQHRKQYKLADSKYREVLAKYPDSEYAPQALFNLARRSSGTARLNYYRQLYKKYPGSRYADDAAWETAWEYYAKKQYRAAAQIFLEGYALDKKSDHADALLYWAGKACQKLGEAGEAERLFLLARQEFPARFYGWRAAQQLKLPPPLPAGQLSLQDIRPRTDRALREFLESGEYDDALAEAERIADQEKKEQTLAALKIYMADAAYRAGDYKEAIKLSSDTLHNNPEYAAILPDLWRICYPRAFRREVELNAWKNSLDENYVYALIREESMYDALALSPADAYGLMQVIPPTAAQIFAKLGFTEELAADVLFQPEINVQLGSYYLREMLNWFEGNPYLALAAYNAGPTVVGRWLRQQGGLARFDVDNFVENISYPETRNYVKRVMRGYWLYSTLYPED